MNTEKQYILAFNNGYILEQYEPDLLTTASQNLNPTNNYLEGLFAGKAQCEVENAMRKIDELKNIRNRSHERTNGFEREN